MRPATRRVLLAFLRWIVVPTVIVAVSGLAIIAFVRWPTGPAIGGAISGLNYAATRSATTGPTSLKIASFNIHSAIDLSGKRSEDRIARLASDYDLVGLQEVRGGFAYSQVKNLTLATDPPSSGVFGPTEWTKFHDDFGNALLTRVPVESWLRIPLPGTQWSHYRNVLMTTTRLDGTAVRVLITHVDRQTDRAAQLQFLWQLFDSLQPPCVIMGDFNTPLDDALLAPFLQAGRNALGDRGGRSRIDHIFTRGLRIIDAGVVENDASDHPLVWAQIEPEPAPTRSPRNAEAK